MSGHDVDPEPIPADATQPVTSSEPRKEPTPAPARQPDPTRYGDWEKDGRCIDF